MEDGDILENVIVIDNGVRCFVPPCFSFEILSIRRERVGVASKLDLDTVGLLEKDVTKGQTRLSGFIKAYNVKSAEGHQIKGLCFVVTNSRKIGYHREND